MNLHDIQKKIKNLKEVRDKLTKTYSRELSKINEELAQNMLTLKTIGRDSDLSRIVRTQPYFSINKDVTPIQLRTQINYLIDGDDRRVDNIQINITDITEVVHDMIFYLEKELERDHA